MIGKKPIVLAILDGWGEWDIEKGNAVRRAKLPTFDRLDKHYPKLFLQASGMSVGLPWGVRGNSEVGHQTIGSGQIIFQYLPTISTSISDGSFITNQVLKNARLEAKKKGVSVHIWGLLSDGAVHSHIDHLFALLEMAGREEIENVYVHAVADGRDTHPQSTKTYLGDLLKKMSSEKIGKLATVSGRYYTMDRNNNWDRTEKAFLAMAEGDGIKRDDVFKAIDEQYAREVTDEYLEPIVLVDGNIDPVGLIKEGDLIVCFNFRKDRSRQLTRAFSAPDFSEFKKAARVGGLKCVCFAQYDEDLPVAVAFTTREITTRLGDILSKEGKTQLRMAETEKYAHVTYFFNGGLEDPFPGEDRVVIPSKKIASYAEAPEMSAPWVMERLIMALEGERYDFILVNFANPDMVGHTGSLGAAIQALEHIDGQIDMLINKVLEKEGQMIITADHGNVEEMINIYSGETDTKHSKNPVPCWYVRPDNYNEAGFKRNQHIEVNGMLVDLAPTILDIIGIAKPKEMIGISLLEMFNDQ